MLDVRFTNKFKKDLIRIEKQGKNPEKLYIVIDSLRQEKKLPSSNHDHSLSGEWAGYRECHIEPDWLLIYKINNKVLELVLIRTGSHPCEIDDSELSYFETPLLCMLTGLVSDKRKDVLSILLFKPEDATTARSMMSDMEGVRFVEIWDRGNTREHSISILLNKAAEDGLKNTD